MKFCSIIARSIISIIIFMTGLLNLSVHANTTAFYGIDLGVGPAGAHPSSDAAKVNFLNAIGSFAVGTETFEDNALGSFFGGTTALAFPSINYSGTLNSESTISAEIRNASNQFVWPISGSRYMFLSTGANSRYFTLTFNSPINAIGFYGISISNNLGFNFPSAQLQIDGIGSIDVVNVDTSTIPDGSVNYFGVYSTVPFSTVRLLNTAPGTDAIELEDITISAVPEPQSALIIVVGLLALLVRTRVRREA